MTETEPTTGPVPAAVRVQILATEHWSLLATRQLAWTEAFTRAGLFLTVLSAGVVALALVGQTGRDFTLFALVLLPVVLLLGLATFLTTGAAVGVGLLAGLLLTGLLAFLPVWQFAGWKTYRPRFPSRSPGHASAPAPGSNGGRRQT